MSCSVCQLPIAESVRSLTPSSSGRGCPFCSAVFSRVDAAKRHARSCPHRRGRELPVGKRGRKAKSCAQCSRVRVYCNGPDQGPCKRCTSRKLECTLNQQCTNAAHRVPEHSNSSDRGEHRRLPLSFLLNFTDEKQDFVTERAVGEEPDGDLLGPTHLSPPGDEMFDFIDPTLLLPCDSEAWLGALQDTGEQGLLGSFAFPAGQGLAARLKLLESEIAAHAHTCVLLRNSFDSDAFHHFFTPSNVNTFATIFCRKRHYQHQVIHWPTFSLEKASLPLLMVVALTGATYSFHSGNGPEHITAARSFYRLADSYVFHELRKCVGGAARPCDMAESIELCQAALLMYALDTLLAGDEGVQCSAMMERLPALIFTMRKLKFIGCRHDPSEDWPLFLQREQIIRLVSWAYGSDCLVTMSFNTPPFFSLMEMTGDLPCHPVLWDSDPTTLDSLRSFRDTTSHCLKDLMSWLLDDNMHPSETLGGVPLFHLHIMLCAFQPIIFHLSATLSLPSQSNRLLRSLSTWRQLWSIAFHELSNDQRKWLGVAKHVPDIEYLSRRIIEVSLSPEAASSQYLQRIPSYTAREIHDFIQEFVSRA